MYELIIASSIVATLSLINAIYRRSYKGLIIQAEDGKYILIKRLNKNNQYIGLLTKGYYKDKELFSYKVKDKKFIVDFWSIKIVEPKSELRKITLVEYLHLTIKYRKFKRIYEDIENYLLSSKYDYLKNGFYYSYGYKKYNLDQIIKRIEKDMSKTIEQLIEKNPDNKKEYQLIEKNYNKKNYKYILEMIPLLDLTGKKLFGVQVFSNNRNKNMYQVIENYASDDYYAFILNNPLICSKRSRLISDDIINRHRLIHDIYKPYYTKENYLRLINMFTAMLKLKSEEY